MEEQILDMLYDVLSEHSEYLRQTRSLLSEQERIKKVYEYINNYPFLKKKRVVKKFMSEFDKGNASYKMLDEVEDLIKKINFSLYDKEPSIQDFKIDSIDESVMDVLKEGREYLKLIVDTCNKLLENKEDLLNFEKYSRCYLVFFTNDDIVNKYKDLFSSLVLHFASTQEKEFKILNDRKQELTAPISIISIPSVKPFKRDGKNTSYNCTFIDVSEKAKYFRKLILVDEELAMSLMLSEKEIILSRIVYDISLDLEVAFELESSEDIVLLTKERENILSILNGGEKIWQKLK